MQWGGVEETEETSNLQKTIGMKHLKRGLDGKVSIELSHQNTMAGPQEVRESGNCTLVKEVILRPMAFISY